MAQTAPKKNEVSMNESKDYARSQTYGGGGIKSVRLSLYFGGSGVRVPLSWERPKPAVLW